MLQAANAALVVIDVQDKLLPKREGAAESLIAKTQKLVQAATALGIPVLVTEQNPQKIGPTAAALAQTLGDTPRIGKMEFGCLNNSDFRAALEATRRRQLLLAGVEAHICVLQTALGAQEMGYVPFVVRDAIASLDPAEEEAGVRRMERHGAELVTAQMAIFELLGAAGTPEFKQLLPLLK